MASSGRLWPGEYRFEVKVYDVIWKSDVTSTVSVRAVEIGDEAVVSSASLRLQG
jgi:hypothetical protein